MVQVASKFSKQSNQGSTYQGSQKESKQENEVEFNLTGLAEEVRIQVKAPKGVSKVPNSICCVVDVSGSMSSLAVTKTNQGNSELGYSILDIVKHSLSTIVQNLDADDHFSVVTFSNQANEIINFESMTDDNKQIALNVINKCYASGGTNIWGGMEKGLGLMKKDMRLEKHQSLIVLTDGQPNVNPPRGVLPTLINHYDTQFLDRKPSINTFGFGYYLDSQLLLQIARQCQGNYSFIPDSSFVGTIFTNSIAAMQSIYATNAVIVFRPLHSDAKLDVNQIKSNFKTYKNSNGETCIELGNLQFDQSKDIIFSQKLKSQLLKDFEVEIHYCKQDSSLQQNRFFKKAQTIENSNELEFVSEQLRLDVVNTINQCQNSTESIQNSVQNMINKLESSKFKDNEYIKALYEDMNGQVKIAVSREDYFQQWGQHYLPSLAMAHTHKLCNNFKDPGIQGYAGSLFSKQRDEIEKVFMSIPPPKPSHSRENVTISSAQYTQHYYSKDNPCFDGNSEVQMFDGTIKKVKEIKKGDQIYCPNTKKSETVKCVIETEVKEKLLPMVRIGQGLLITPYHPVRIQGKWVFPSEIAQTKIASCPSVYSFLLESGHSMKINGVECVTFAHGFSDDKVKHEYFGSQKIIKDLFWMKGYWNGHVKLNDSPAIRDSHTGLIIGLRSNRKWISSIQDFKNSSLINTRNLFLNRFLKLSKKFIRI